MVWFQITWRKMPLTESAAPASARQTSATGREGAKPKAVMASPQQTAATITPRPWRLTREVQPLVALASRPPRAGAEKSSPSTAGPPEAGAATGKKELGKGEKNADMCP